MELGTMVPGLRVAQRFEIETLVRSGQMGKLFRAHDLQTEKTVALRLLRLAAGARAPIQVHFDQILERLTGLAPEDLTPLAYGQIETGEVYVVTAWLEGEDLGQRLLHKPLRVGESLELMRSVSRTLSLLHAQGLVHGELRPSRLFLRGGSVRNTALLGLGLPRLHLSARTLTRPGEMASSLRYVAPELLCRDEPPRPQADIFALGCVLFECLAGAPLFTGAHAGTVLAHVLYDEASPLGQLRPELPRALGQLLARMLARPVSERMAHGQELLEALAAIELLPEHAEMQPLPPPTSPLAGTEQRLVSLVLALSPLMSAGTVAAQEATLDGLRRDFGARVEVLADGSLLMTRVAEDATRQTATDQAAQMARAARRLAEIFPTWRVAVSMGRGMGAGFDTAGEALHRAVALLGEEHREGEAQAHAGTSAREIWLDELTAELLDMRFRIHRPQPDRSFLGEERHGTEAPRRLLGRPTPCVGREQELRLLSALMAGCTEEKRARAVLVLGLSGIGKSRLRHELVRRLATEGGAVTVMQGRGDALQAGMAYGLLGQALCELCGLPAALDPAERRARLKAEVERRIPPEDAERVAGFLGELCGLPFPDDANPQLRAARQDPRLMGDQVKSAFLALLRAECTRQPVLLILEDLHWSDEATVRLCEAALQEFAERPLLVLGLGRPEIKERFPRLWESCPVQELWLGSLSRKAGEQLVRAVLGPGAPAETVARIVEQAGGHALFLEELIRAVAEGAEEFPETVLITLQARFLRFEPRTRRVLAAASVFGATFWRGGLVALLGLEGQGQGQGQGLARKELDPVLELLVAGETIARRQESRVAGEVEYAFRHALVREAAYGLLTEEDRRAGHRAVGQYLERVGERTPVVLAEHYQRGGELERAAHFFVLAALEALGGSDLPGALRCVEQGFACGAMGEVLGTLLATGAWARIWTWNFTAGYEMARAALPLLEPGSAAWCRAIGAVVGVATPLGQPEVVEEYARILARTQPHPGVEGVFLEQLFMAIAGTMLAGLVPESEALLARMHEVGARLGTNEMRARGMMQVADALYGLVITGDRWRYYESSKEATACFVVVGDRRYEVIAESHAGLAQALLGDGAAALPRLRAVIEQCRALGEVLMAGVAQGYLALALFELGAPGPMDEVEALAEAVLAGVQVHNFWSGMALCAQAGARALRGDLKAAERAARDAFSTAVAIGPLAAALLGRILLGLGRREEARTVVEQELTRLAGRGGTGFMDIKLHLVAAEVRQAQGERQAADQALNEAAKRLQQRAALIPHGPLRERYLYGLRDHARVFELQRHGAI